MLAVANGARVTIDVVTLVLQNSILQNYYYYQQRSPRIPPRVRFRPAPLVTPSGILALPDFSLICRHASFGEHLLVLEEDLDGELGLVLRLKTVMIVIALLFGFSISVNNGKKVFGLFFKIN